MKFLDNIHRLIIRDDEVGVSKILVKYGLEWFVFGFILGGLVMWVVSII